MTAGKIKANKYQYYVITCCKQDVLDEHIIPVRFPYIVTLIILNEMKKYIWQPCLVLGVDCGVEPLPGLRLQGVQVLLQLGDARQLLGVLSVGACSD